MVASVEPEAAMLKAPGSKSKELAAACLVAPPSSARIVVVPEVAIQVKTPVAELHWRKLAPEQVVSPLPKVWEPLTYPADLRLPTASKVPEIEALPVISI